MKKREVDHVLRAAGEITREKQFIIVGSQALHGRYPDLADEIVRSAEVDLWRVVTRTCYSIGSWFCAAFCIGGGC